MTVKRGLRVAAVGIALFVIGFAIGSTQSNETGTLNTIAAVLGTAGAGVALVGVVITIGGLLRPSS